MFWVIFTLVSLWAVATPSSSGPLFDVGMLMIMGVGVGAIVLGDVVAKRAAPLARGRVTHPDGATVDADILTYRLMPKVALVVGLFAIAVGFLILSVAPRDPGSRFDSDGMRAFYVLAAVACLIALGSVLRRRSHTANVLAISAMGLEYVEAGGTRFVRWVDTAKMERRDIRWQPFLNVVAESSSAITWTGHSMVGREVNETLFGRKVIPIFLARLALPPEKVEAMIRSAWLQATARSAESES